MARVKNLVSILASCALFATATAHANLCFTSLAAYALHLEHGPNGLSAHTVSDLLADADVLPAGSVESTLATYARTALHLNGIVDVVPPATPPTSGARVYVIRNNGLPVAVFKIFVGDPQGLTRELGAIDALRRASLQHLSPVSALRAARVRVDGAEHYGLLMTYGPTADLESMIGTAAKTTGPTRLTAAQNATRAVATGLAEMHRHFAAEAPDPVRVAANRDYEVSRLQAFVAAGGLLEQLSGQGWLTPLELQAARARIQAIAAEYGRSTPSLLTLVHGDAHPANFTFHPQLGTAQAIDLQTMLWSAAPSSPPSVPHGASDANMDVGRFVAGLQVAGQIHGLGDRGTQALRNTFLDAYSRELGVSRESVERNLTFHRLRFLSAVLGDVEGRKTTETQRREILDRLLRELGARTP